MKETFQKILRTVERFEMVLAKILLLAMVAVVGMQVFFRYGFNRPLTWPEELSGFLLIWLTFIVADILFKRNGHVQVDYFAGKLSPRTQLVVSFIVNLYIMAFLVFLIIASIQIGLRQTKHLVGAALKLPKTFYTLAATVSGISMLVSAIVFQFETMQKIIAPHGKEKK
jgi:TRAP-type C4-dicarboxylate transport system permease small subunit